MTRRLLGAVAAVALAMAACGDAGTTTTAPGATAPTSTAPATTISTTSTPPPATTTPPPTGAPATTTTSTTAATTTLADDTVRVEVTVEQGSVAGGASTVEVDLDAAVEITVTADVADEVHVHGYDAFADVAPGHPAVVELVATIPGIFEVELEGARLLLLELEVR